MSFRTFRPCAVLLIAGLAVMPALHAGSSTIELGSGDAFTVQDTTGTPLFRVDGTGDITPETSEYARTIIVSPVGTVVANGTELLDAMASITDASSTKPYLLKIEPGVYDLGTNELGMKEWVDVEGSGEGVTMITGTGGDSPAASPVVRGASNAQLRYVTLSSFSEDTNGVGYYAGTDVSADLFKVTVRATNASSFGYGVYLINCSDATLDHLSVVVEGNTSGSYGIGAFLCSGEVKIRNSEVVARSSDDFNIGISTNSFITKVRNTDVDALGGNTNVGIRSNKSNTELRSVRSVAGSGTTDSFGLELDDDNTGSVDYGVFVQHSELRGREAAATTAPDTGLRIAATQLSGDVQGTDNLTCAGVYNGTYTFFASSCP